ncbi:MAG TPA: ice-binding family protein [Methylomirabilota bacterium]|nr:ice-binding family protein [Methylomirabilota bacterium]
MRTQIAVRSIVTEKLNSADPGMKIGWSGPRRILMGLVLAGSLMLLNQGAAAGTSILHVLFKAAMVNSGVDPNAQGTIDGTLTRQGNANNQRLKITLTNLDPGTEYQMLAFIGDDNNPRSATSFTTDSKGAFTVTYVQKCPGKGNPGGQPLPNALDPISHIHQLDIVKDGNVLLTGVIGSDIQGDCDSPTVSATVPADGATDVPANQAVAATFSEAMNPATITGKTFTLKAGKKAVSGTVTYAGTTAVFTPAGALDFSTAYTATITTRATDVSGNGLAHNFVWHFTTGGAPDDTAPTVISTAPANSATGVPVSQTLAATFSEAMDQSTISASSFTLTGPGATPVTGTVAYDAVSHTATFAPASALTQSTAYTATITTAAKDLAGNSVASDAVWTFTTAASTGGQGSVVLGGAGGFAVLAGSTVTSVGATTVNGDLGVSPGTAVTGFPPGLVNGTTHAGDAAAAQAQLDLTTAYNDAAGRTVGAVTLAGNLGGLTLTPGLYKSTSSLEVSSGDLTLDAQGNANAVFIFQMASTLTTTSGRQVILSGGAKASNIFWQVGSSATLGTTSVFKGTIMADQSITLATGATLDGRALARVAAVTMDANTVSLPAP